jgi:hypothetical protein
MDGSRNDGKKEILQHGSEIIDCDCRFPTRVREKNTPACTHKREREV